MILLLNQFFHPDAAATSQLLTDAARELARTGPVIAICGRSDYAAHASAGLTGITTRRTPNLPFARGKLGRILSYASFYSSATALALTTRRPDAVLTLTTPPLLSLVGTLLKSVRGSRHYIWEMDLYPDIATDLGVFKLNGLLARSVAALNNWSRHRADGIIALGDEMKSRLVAHGIPAEKVTVCENWADGRAITPRPFPTGPLTIHYSGNFGLAHDFDTIAGAIQRLAHDSRFRFVFSGGGPRLEHLKKLGCPNVEFLPYSSRADLGRSLAQGHLGLVTQVPATLGSVAPSKTYGIMAAGRPILYIGPENATPARHIRQFDCGWRINPGDIDSLVSLLQTLETTREPIYTAGNRARAAFEANFDLPLGVTRILNVLRPATSLIPIHGRSSKASTAF